MSTKFISLATAIVFLDVYLQSQLSSSAPLFLFASSGQAVNAGLIILVALMVRVSFMNRFRHWWTYAACAVAAVFLCTVGVLGGFFSDSLYYFPSFLLPLDYLFLLEAGVIFGIGALSYQHQPVPFKLNLPRLALPRFKLALPSPKLSTPPSAQRGRRVLPA